jgi:hypothetical protein
MDRNGIPLSHRHAPRHERQSSQSADSPVLSGAIQGLARKLLDAVASTDIGMHVHDAHGGFFLSDTGFPQSRIVENRLQ